MTSEIVRSLWEVAEGTRVRLIVRYESCGGDLLTVEGGELILYAREPPLRGREVAAAFLKSRLKLHDGEFEMRYARRGVVEAVVKHRRPEEAAGMLGRHLAESGRNSDVEALRP